MTNKINKVFITGCAGFIGFHLSKKLMDCGHKVFGVDSLNDYYDVRLKESRLSVLKGYTNFSFVKGDLTDEGMVMDLLSQETPDVVVNLAAQPGVRYSIENPRAYIESNIIGFFNILEGCRHFPVDHLVFASSSSVYGMQEKTPFSIEDNVDHPISLYAATKKSDELMAYCYSHLYQIPTTGLRFFTVYGPYGRPDMAYFSFAKKIMEGEPIKIYNQGDMLRDFTYIDDIVEGITRVIASPPAKNKQGDPFKVYNIGNNKPERLMDFIEILEKQLGVRAKKEYLPMQPGDVYQTYADIDELVGDFNFKPQTTIEEGLSRFVEWFKSYYKL